MQFLHALNLIFWQNYPDLCKILKAFPKPQILFQNQKSHILQTLNQLALSPSAKEILKTDLPRLDPDYEFGLLQKNHIKLTTISEKDYPAALKNIATPPLILYYKGNLPLDWDLSVSIVGTRRPSPYGKLQTEYFTSFLSRQKVIIISGLAFGIDSIAHQTALKENAVTIAVLGSGIEKIYPASHTGLAAQIVEKNGAVLSEYPPNAISFASNFPRRNRIISGLSKCTLIVEGREKSGSLITARFALEQNKEIFAIPGDINRIQSQAPNKLISNSQAQLVISPQEITEALGLQPQNQTTPKPELTEQEQEIFNYIIQIPLSADEIIRATGLPAPAVQSSLSLLELKGFIKKDRDKFYAGSFV